MLKNTENELEILRKKAANLESKLAAQDIEIRRHLDEKMMMDLSIQKIVQHSAQKQQEAEQRYQESVQRHQESVQRHQLIETQLQERLKKKEDDYDRLVQKHMEMMRNRFGRKSERFVDCENPQELLFPIEFDGVDPNPDPEDIEPVSPNKSRTPRKRRSLEMSNLPQREVIVPVDPEDRVCTCCGREKQHVGYQSSSRLHVIPAQFEVVTEKREKLACPKGCEGQFVTASLPLRVLPKSVAAESLIAHICVSKVLDRQPLYHLEKVTEQRFNWKIGRNLMADWMIAVADRIQPLINLMKEQLEDYDIAAIDATSFHVLKEPGRASQTKSYAYCIRGGPPDKRVILYEYNAYNHKSYVDETLSHFNGVLSCDASTVFNKIGAKETVKLSYCHAHARRKFEQIEKAGKKGKTVLATEAMRIYRQLYDIERQATDANLTPENRQQLRQEKSGPILDRFYEWLTVNRDKTLPKSPIGQAIAYCLTHWDGLCVYLSDGRVDIDNNATERDIKPFVIARKNFLFACTQQGADSLGVHFSLILTARLHGLDPMAYYAKMLKRLPYCFTPDEYAALLPWNWTVSES